MRILVHTGNAILIALLVGLASMTACGGAEEEDMPLARPVGETPPAEAVKITIGNLTDKTGVSANALGVIDMALEDLVEYYNEEDLIPGLQLDVVTYDGQWDPSRDIPGYEWLRNKGADVIWTAVPPAVQTLKARVDSDRLPLFSPTANMDMKDLEGGYVFGMAITPEYEAYTLLDWIAENDPDFPQDRPARIGGAAWLDGYSNIWFEAAERYAKAHPDRYEWVEGYLSEFSFVWDAEVEGLKNCDYVYLPTPMHNFVEQYRFPGYTAKFLATDVQLAFLGMIDKADLWDEIDGMFASRSSRWYNEQGPVIDLTNRLLDEKHPGEADEIRRRGSGYIGGKQAYLLLEIIRDASETLGPSGVNSDTIYDAAKAFSFELDGIEGFASFDETKRYVQNYYAIYEASAEDRNLVRVEPKWIEQVMVP